MFLVKRIFSFEAAHHLPGYDGDCARVHGHSYKLEISVKGDISKRGMVIDFRDLGDIVKKEVLSKLDHSDLNDTLIQPTAENVARWVYGRLKPKIPGLYEICVHETDKCSALYREEQ